jgi:chemotaxis protein methyltransferase CheR
VSAVPGNLEATPAEIELFRSLLLARMGLHLGPDRQAFLINRVQRGMQSAGARSFYDYYRKLVQPGPGRELQGLLEAVAIHETSFFRNPMQFTLLGQTVLPERMSARLSANQRSLRMWSAGCSTGQEAFTLAMTVYESLVLPPSWDLQLLATDVSDAALRQGEAGKYTLGQLDGLSAERRARYFDRRGAHHVVRPWLRRGMRFERRNLLDAAPMGGLDVLFCRNVLIYFDRQGQRALLARLADALVPGGYLFLGHSESPAGLSDAFQMVSVKRAIAYRRLP